MTTLPATLAEGEAVLATRRVGAWLDQCQREDWMNLGISMVNPEAGHIQVRQILKCLALSPADPFKVYEIIDWARAGWEDADLAMRELVVELDNRGQEVPLALKAYRNELMNPYRQQHPRAHGAQRATHFLQDIVIATFAGKLHAEFPAIPFYGRSPRKASICGIVAKVFTAAKLGRSFESQGVWKVCKRLSPAL